MEKLGGQALFNGVTVQSKTKKATATRLRSKRINVRKSNINNWILDKNLDNIVFLRGILIMFDNLYFSFNKMNFKEIFEGTTFDKIIKKVFKSKESIKKVYFLTVLSILSLIFILIPLIFSGFIFNFIKNSFLCALFEFIFRFSIILFYINSISKENNNKELFMYHGAEHKAINCYENNLEINLENIRKSSRFHKRCGTNFLSISMIISIIIFTFIGFEKIFLEYILRCFSSIFIVSICYEIIEFIGDNDNFLINILCSTGFLVQKFTTKEPNDEHIEVAIEAINEIV